MGARRRVRQTGKTAPSLATNLTHNRHDGFTWEDAQRERAVIEQEVVDREMFLNKKYRRDEQAEEAEAA